MLNDNEMIFLTTKWQISGNLVDILLSYSHPIISLWLFPDDITTYLLRLGIACVRAWLARVRWLEFIVQFAESSGQKQKCFEKYKFVSCWEPAVHLEVATSRYSESFSAVMQKIGFKKKETLKITVWAVSVDDKKTLKNNCNWPIKERTPKMFAYRLDW